MAISPSVIAFTVILVLYITVGVFAAIGTAYVSKALLPPKVEQVFYAVYLTMIAGFYLAFTVYFGSEQAWRVESTAVLCFAPSCARRTFGLRTWTDDCDSARLWCLLRRVCMAGYFFARRAHWNAGEARTGPGPIPANYRLCRLD
jgi:hypothetical protein